MEDRRRILEEAFGESSSSDTEYENERSNLIHTNGEKSPSSAWERVKEIDGLWLCNDFLSPEQQCRLLASIQREGWFIDASHNQAMRFGDLPEWALELSELVHEAVLCSKFFSECGDLGTPEEDVEACPLAFNLLSREPLFDQLIVNVYQPGEGICSHVDLLRFDDGIAIVSLESTCVMHFTRAVAAQINQKEGEDTDSPDAKVPLLLLPGSLVLMSGEARYGWKHEINRKPGFQVWEGQEIDQSQRTSVTLRRLCQTK